MRGTLLNILTKYSRPLGLVILWRCGELNPGAKKNIYIHLRCVDHLILFKSTEYKMSRNAVPRFRILER